MLRTCNTLTLSLSMAVGLWACGDINVGSNTGAANTGANQAGVNGGRGGTQNNAGSDTNAGANRGEGTGGGPDAYFVAVQCQSGQPHEVGAAWNALKQMVTAADDKDITLTLMFSPPWAEWIGDKPDELNRVQQWKDDGHEIAGLHKSIYAGSGWDGFTDLSTEQYIEIMGDPAAEDAYRGSLDDWLNALEVLNADLNSGCSGGQIDKRSMPNAVTYDACAGFSQRDEDELGTRSATLQIADMGVNDFVLEGVVAGVTRKWLTHAAMDSQGDLDDAENLFNKLNGGVYGVMFHAEDDATLLMEGWLGFLDDFDQGQGSHTLKSIIEQQLIPKRNLSADALDAVYEDEQP